jgi:hypothetical protein
MPLLLLAPLALLRPLLPASSATLQPTNASSAAQENMWARVLM